MSRYSNNQFNIDFKSDLITTEKIKAGIFLAGGGGVSEGFKNIPEIELVWILNHDKTALRTSAYHNKGAKIYWADIYVQDENEMEPVELVQVSLECDEHTSANTDDVKDAGSYTMGWEFNRYLKRLNPLVIHVENVKQFKNWAPLDHEGKPDKLKKGEEFKKWKKAVMDLGYEYIECICNAADYGLPTSRERFFCFFYRPGINISFPKPTHSKNGEGGKIPWNTCRRHINTDYYGESIFGREFNENLPKQHRRPLCKNSLQRIAGGIRKQWPDFYQFLAKYHAGENPERSQSLDEPIKVIDTSNRHQLITITGSQFIQDHCITDNYQSIDEPLRPQLSRQTKQLITLKEKLSFIMDHCHSDKVQGLNEPLQPQTTRQTKQIVNVEVDEAFIVQYYGNIQSNSLDEPINTITCRDTHQLIMIEKMQFIVKYFNSSGHPEVNVQGLDVPLSPVLGTNKHQLITILDNFDIRARFLDREELASCSTFPRDYFSHPQLKLSQKAAIQLIGNAVPPYWMEVQMKLNIPGIKAYKMERMSA